MKLKLPIFLAIFIATFYFCFYSRAQTIKDSNDDSARNDEFSCEYLNNSLTEKILETKLKNLQNLENYKIAALRLENLSYKATLLSYMTTSLNTNITKLKSYISNFEKNSNLIVQKLELARKSTCNDYLSQQYNKAIIDSKQALNKTISDTHEIELLVTKDIYENIISFTKLEAED